MNEKKVWAPPVVFYFRVEFLGQPSITASFLEVEGLKLEMEVEEVREGGENGAIYYLPKSFKHDRLILKRALEPLSDSFEKWINDTMDCQLAKKIHPVDVTVSLLDANNKPVAKWVCMHAYPVKWDVGVLNAMENKLVIETLELCYSHLRRKEI